MFKRGMYSKAIVILHLIFWLLLFRGLSEATENGKAIMVACEDRMIYKVDLNEGNVIYRTPVIENLGKPTAIDFNRNNGLLYVASERGHFQERYYPIVVIDMMQKPGEVINSFKLIENEPSGSLSGVSPVFNLVLSPNGKTLYIAYARPEYERGSTLVDSKTGEIFGHLDFYVTSDMIFSGNGNHVAEIWPGGKKVYKENNQEHVKEWLGGVSVRDIENNRRASKKDINESKAGLNPPWSIINHPLYYVKENRFLHAYDRKTGEKTVEMDLATENKNFRTFVRQPIIFEKDNTVALPVVGENMNGYIVVIDSRSMKIIKTVEVCNNPTNMIKLP